MARGNGAQTRRASKSSSLKQASATSVSVTPKAKSQPVSLLPSTESPEPRSLESFWGAPGSTDRQAIPQHWIKGQLLDVKRYSNGSFVVVAFGEEAAKDEEVPSMKFASTFDAQAFVSDWYKPGEGR